MASSGSIWVSLGLKTDQFTKGISKAKGSLNGFQKFSAGLKNMFNPFTIGVGAVAGLGAALSNAIGIVNDFEKANSKLKAILGENGTAGAMKLMSDQAKQLGASTAFTAGEVSGLQTELAKLGFDVSEIENMTGAVLDLAAASGTELAEAAANTGAIINAFGLESGDAAHVADVMASSFSKSALDMEKFSETMKNASPIARAAGVSLEVATAAAGKLADANISGSKAGTDLRRIFSELVKDGKPFADSLDDIAGKMNGASTKAEKLAIAEDLVGKRAKGALLVLVDQKDELGFLASELDNADGSARAMADTMLDNVAGSLTKANSAYEGFVLSLEDGNGVISEAAQGVIDLGTSYIQFLTALNNAESGFNGFLELTESAAAITGGMSQEQARLTKNIAQNATNIGVLNKMLDEGTISQKQHTAAVKKLAEGWKPANKELKEAATKTIPATVVETKKLTKAQIEAAEKAKLLKQNIEDASNIKLTFVNLSKDLNAAFDGITADNEPKEMTVMVRPKLELEEGNDSFGDMIELGNQAGAALSRSLVGAASAGLVGLGEVLGSGGGIAEFGESLISGFSSLLSSFGQQMIQLGLGMLALKAALALGPLGAGLAIAGGVALIAIAAGIKSSMSEAGSTGFAAGGLVTGSVFANVGEGRGTTRANPEVISPLDRLQAMIPSGGDGMGGEVVFRIQGNELVGILNRQSKNNKFSN
jgi:hypothetical protein